MIPKSVTLNGKIALILPNLIVSGAHCVRVVDKAITTDNLRLRGNSKRLRDSHGMNIL